MSEHADAVPVLSKSSPTRWLAVLLISAFFHWTAIEWATGSLVFPAQTDTAESLVTANLHSRPAKTAPPKAAKPVPKKRAKAANNPPVSPPPQATHSDAVDHASAEATAQQEPVETAQNDFAAASGEDTNSTFPIAADEAVEDPTSADFAMHLPPPAELNYDVHAQKKGFTYYGTGIINWQTDGTHYQITGKAKAAFFTVLEFKSEGEIEAGGIAPILYAERSGNRAGTNTHFHRERNTISFSASTLSYPRVGGEQDRASIIWQLAALGRASPQLFKSGEELNIFVAGVRNAAPWRIYILGEEEVELDGTPVKTWHVKSVPQQGGYEKTFDIWFASAYEWYPVKLRQTEVSGDYLELILSNLVLAQQ